MVRRKEVRLAMPEIVLRVRLIGGDHVDVTYEEADAVDQDTVPSTPSPRLPGTPAPFVPDMVTGSSCVRPRGRRPRGGTARRGRVTGLGLRE